MVGAGRGDRGWVPCLEPHRRIGLGCQDGADPPAEAALIRLDQMADALVGAPLPGGRAPAGVAAEATQLVGHDRHRRLEQSGDRREVQW